MKIDVKKVAQLANLKIEASEISKFEKQLSDVLEHIAKLNELDTKSVEPTSQVTGLENILREDKEKESFTQEQALSNADSTHNGYFKVKGIFDDEYA